MNKRKGRPDQVMESRAGVTRAVPRLSRDPRVADLVRAGRVRATVKALTLTIPPPVLLQTDKVIE